jgi:hypothetical protein
LSKALHSGHKQMTVDRSTKGTPDDLEIVKDSVKVTSETRNLYNGETIVSKPSTHQKKGTARPL